MKRLFLYYFYRLAKFHKTITDDYCGWAWLWFMNMVLSLYLAILVPLVFERYGISFDFVPVFILSLPVSVPFIILSFSEKKSQTLYNNLEK